VDDKVLVRELDCRANFSKKFEPCGHPEMLLTDERRERGAASYVFHDEEGQSIVSLAAVEEPSDARMLEPGQDLALGSEAAEHFLGIGASL
jgi:hypothetical protein